MSKNTNYVDAPPFKQIAVTTGRHEDGGEEFDMIYGLDEDGRVWVRSYPDESMWSLIGNKARPQ